MCMHPSSLFRLHPLLNFFPISISPKLVGGGAYHGKDLPQARLFQTSIEVKGDKEWVIFLKALILGDSSGTGGDWSGFLLL